MSGLSPADADLGVRRRRIVFRAWHRGIREMDLVLGRFADAHAATLTPGEVDDFEALMDAPDPEVFQWITGAKPTPPNYETALLQRIRAFDFVAAPQHG
jgi:antitoxin CptB